MRDEPGARALAFEAVTSRKGRVVEQVRYWRQRLQESASERIRQQALDERQIQDFFWRVIGPAIDLLPPTDLLHKHSEKIPGVMALGTESCAQRRRIDVPGAKQLCLQPDLEQPPAIVLHARITKTRHEQVEHIGLGQINRKPTGRHDRRGRQTPEPHRDAQGKQERSIGRLRRGV